MMPAKSRFLAGALNGNIGVMKSMLAEMADETNIAQAFAIIPLSWALGVAAGYVGSSCRLPPDANILIVHMWVGSSRGHTTAGQNSSATRSGYNIHTFFHVQLQVGTQWSPSLSHRSS
jgi:hypothetical protein